ncbi:UPF0488 protein CG14286 [Athalia rosae]|uniref:UPF0488 protein CG14286 n=1 Tax=Athalia rosae TaxID=37344 RepID=UPI002033C4F4|nr:UPF0488 protein CG14286 [Athalia rosae]
MRRVNMPPKYKPGGKNFPPKRKPPSSLSSQALEHLPDTLSSSSSTMNTLTGLDSEAEDQLELELCWCIQQLHTALSEGKLSVKQTLDINRTLKVLKSSNAPLIKKRQFMRTTFGDYRTKMENDKKKLGKTTSIVKFTETPKEEKNKHKSIFVKKAAKFNIETNSSEAHGNTDSKSLFRISHSGDDNFKFNFDEPKE